MRRFGKGDSMGTFAVVLVLFFCIAVLCCDVCGIDLATPGGYRKASILFLRAGAGVVFAGALLLGIPAVFRWMRGAEPEPKPESKRRRTRP